MTAALVVDDEPAILRLVSMVLQDLGFETLTAKDAETAEELLESSQPDLVVTDVRLPGMDGVELCRRIKSSRRLKDTPVLLMSAYSEPPQHPGDGFIPKPFDISELEDAFSHYVAAIVGEDSGNGQNTASPG